MPFALLIIGVVLITAGVRNSQDDLFKLVKGDFTGDSNFFFWFVSILFIGAIGYVKALKPISTAFLVLVLLVLFLTKGNPSSSSGGFFAKFTQALGSTVTNTNPSNASVSGTQNNTIQQLQQRNAQILQQLWPMVNGSDLNLNSGVN